MITKKSIEVLNKVKKCMGDESTPDDIPLPELLTKSGVSEADYTKALSVSKTGTTIILKRDPASQWTNSFNIHCLHAWQANMDLQYIIDPYSCIMYVTSYMMKSEKAMSELLLKVSKETGAEEVKTQMAKLGSTFLNHREVSAQEAAYRLLSLPLKKSTRSVVFVNTSPKEKRVAILKPAAVLSAMDDDDEDIFYNNINDRYAARPHKLDNMSLAEFAATFTLCRNTADDAADLDHQPEVVEESAPETHKQERITLMNGLGVMYRRKKVAIIRFHKEKEDGEAKYRHLLMLYWPWHDEAALLGGHQSYQHHYEAVRDIITANEDKYTYREPGMDDALNDLQEYGPPEHAWDLLAPGAQQQQADQEAEGIQHNRHMEPDDLLHNADIGNNPEHTAVDRNAELHARYTSEASKALLSPAEYRDMMRSLNQRQQEIMYHHRQWCKQSVIALKTGKPPPVYRLFVSGPGGVGKSHLIKLIHYDTVRLLRLSNCFDPDDVIVLVTAFTGVAAFNIDGLTLHSAFLLETGNKQHIYRSLGSDKQNTLRSRLSKLRLLIIDEVSMVGADILYQIHRRLEDIMASTGDTRFGNVSILAVGDLYQLQPVLQNHVFASPRDDYARLHGSLWQENFQLVELTESMRQRDDLQFAEALNRVRTATCTQRDVEMFQSREIKETDPKYLRVLNVNIIKIPCQDYTKDRNTAQLNLTAPAKSSDTGGLKEEISIAKGARVMLTLNIDVSDGLVNGACGTVEKIIFVDHVPNIILVVFDSARTGQKAIASSQYKATHPNAVPLIRHEATFAVGRGRGHIQMTRRQFPLTLCWGCTIHKVQGKTLDQIVVSMAGKGAFMPGQAYVALSRVKTLDGLFIVGFKASAIRTNPAIITEMTRLTARKLQVAPRPVPSGHTISIVFLNVRSYLEHLPDLRLNNIIRHANIVCFVETFLTPRIDITENRRILQEMKYIQRQDRAPSLNLGRGGLMVMSCEQTPRLHMTDITLSTLEYMSVTTNIRQHSIQLYVIYARPSVSRPLLINDLQALISNCDLHHPIIICGDFNVDLLHATTEHALLTLMSKHGFRQLITEATTDNGTLIDHAYCNFTHPMVTAEVIDCYFSDHDLISLKVTV